MRTYLAYYRQENPCVIFARRNKGCKPSFELHDRLKGLFFLLRKAELLVRQFKLRNIDEITHCPRLVHHPMSHRERLHKIHEKYPKKDGLTG